MKKQFCLSMIFMLFFCAVEAKSRATPQSVDVSGGKIEYYSMGRGSPIVLIPGYATDVSSWSARFLQNLAAHHRLIIINNRGVGRSIINSLDYKSADLAADTAQLIKNLQLKKPAVLGISMGGMIALQTAASYPEQVGQLILINTAISGPRAVHPSPEMEKRLLSLPYNKIGFYFVAVNAFFPSSWKIRMAFKLVTDRFLPPQLKEVNLRKIIPLQKELLLDWSRDEATAKKISRITVPVLILKGNADVVLPPVNSLILAKKIAHSNIVEWQDGGHAMIYQYPREIARSIDEFLHNFKPAR